MRHHAIAVAFVGLGALAIVEAASGEAGRWLAAHRAAGVLRSVPGLSAGSVSARGAELTIDDIDYRASGGARLHIGRLTLPSGLGGGEDIVGTAAAAPAGVVATDLSITIGHTLVVMPRVVAQGSYLTADRLKALLDPAAGLSMADRLKEMTAASVTAPSVTVTSVPPSTNATPADADDEGQATFESVVLTDVVAGRIGSASIGKMTAVASAAPGARTVATLGPAMLDGLDLPLAFRIAETGRMDPAEAPGVVYGSLSVHDIAIAPDETGSLRIGSISADGFRGRPLLRRPVDVVALVNEPSSQQTPDDVRAITEIAIDAAKGFSLDHLEWDDVVLSTTGNGGTRFELGRVSIDGLSPTQIGTWALNRLTFASDEGYLSVMRMAFHGPDESELVEVLMHELATSGLAMDRTRLMSGIPQDGSFSMLGLHGETPSGDQPGNSPDGHHHVFDIPVLSFASETDPKSKIATSTAHAQATYAVPTTSGNPGFAALARAGFQALDTRADYRLVFDPEGRGLRLEPLALEAEKLGRVSLSAEAGNIPYDLLAHGRSATDAQAAFDNVTFKRFGFDLRNDGAAELLFPMLAAGANTSVPMFKAGAKTQSDLFIGQTLGATPAAARLEAAIDAFIDDPRNLHIVVTAPDGLSAAELQVAPDPKALLGRVGIEAVANR